MNFAQQLAALPAVDHLAAIILRVTADTGDGTPAARIENQPGQAGSLRVYAALAQRHGGRITPAAAAEGLAIYAEHTQDARDNPGKHPNIDRLIALIDQQTSLAVEEVAR